MALRRRRAGPKLVALAASIVLVGALAPVAPAGADAVTDTYTVPGTYFVSVPAYTTSMEAIAAGASGSAGSSSSSGASNGGSGGGGTQITVVGPWVPGRGPLRATRSVATITGSNTGLSTPVGLTFDSAGHLWVANFAANSLTEYSASARGNVKPLATIAGAATGLDGPQALTLDASNHLLVADAFGESLTEYATSPSGDASPLRTITGAATGLSFPVGVDVDTVGNIYVANEFAGVTKYAAGATGDAAPLATISGSATGLSTPEKLAVAPPLSVATQRLRRARVGHRYRLRLRAYLGTTPYHWKIVRGRLAPGIHLKRNGLLWGRPRRHGIYRFTVRVRDSTRPRMTAENRFALRIRRG